MAACKAWNCSQPVGHPEPQRARSLHAGKGPGRPATELEGRHAGRPGPHRLADCRHRLVRLVPQELQRDVHVRRSNPTHLHVAGPQAADQAGGPRTDQLRNFHRDECACHGHLGCRQENVNASDLLAAGVEEYSSNHASIRQPSRAQTTSTIRHKPQSAYPQQPAHHAWPVRERWGSRHEYGSVMLSIATLLALSHWMLSVCAETPGLTIRCRSAWQ